MEFIRQAENSGSAFAQGALLGLVAETRLVVTYSQYCCSTRVDFP
jgi:hypothetical protein